LHLSATSTCTFAYFIHLHLFATDCNVFAEPPLTEIEKQRAQNIMRMNERMQQLGVKRLAEIVRQSSRPTKKASRNKKYHGQHSDRTELEVPTLLLMEISVFVCTFEVEISQYLMVSCLCLLCKAVTPPVAARGASSKRVLAPDNLEQTRCTRQSVAREKEAASLSLVEASKVPPPVPDSTSIQNEEGMDIAEEGKCLQLFISMSIYVI